MRGFEGMVNPDKAFCWGLPDAPPLQYQGNAKSAILLFWLFGTDGHHSAPLNYFIKSACWARHTWLRNTDLMDHNIPIKLYVEDYVMDECYSTLLRHGVSGSDCLVFNAKDLEQSDRTRSHCGKKIAYVLDDQLSDYDWVVMSDADLFWGRGMKYSGRFPFFEKLFVREPEIGMVTSWPRGESCYQWCDNVYTHPDLETRRLHWLNDVRRFTSPGFAEDLDSKIQVSLGGALHAFPFHEFTVNRSEQCLWLYDFVKTIRNDEAVFSIYQALGNQIWGMHQEFDMPYFYGEFAERYHQEGVFLTHANRQHDEYFFRKSIGAL